VLSVLLHLALLCLVRVPGPAVTAPDPWIDVQYEPARPQVVVPAVPDAGEPVSGPTAAPRPAGRPRPLAGPLKEPPPPPAQESPTAPEPALPTGDPFRLSYAVLAHTLGPLPAAEEEGPRSIEEMLEAYEAELKAATAVHTGNYDPGLLTLRNAMEDFWHPSFDELHDDPLKGSVGKMLVDWQKQAQKYGKAGSPGDDPVTNENFSLKTKDMGVLDTYEQIEESGAFTTRARLVVVIRFDGQGGWKLEKVKGSGHGDVDAAAVKAVEDALTAFPELLPDHGATTRWALEADFSVDPPLPVAGFSFDLALGHFEVHYPLKKSVSRRIKLLAVDEAEPAAPGKGGGSSQQMAPVAG
jgi:hypothetical protein